MNVVKQFLLKLKLAGYHLMSGRHYPIHVTVTFALCQFVSKMNSLSIISY